MDNPPLGPLGPLLEQLAELVASKLERRAPAGDSGAFYDQHTAPVSSTAFLRAARAGAFPSHRVGKRVLAERALVDAWIKAHPSAARPKVEPAPVAPPPPTNSLERLRAKTRPGGA